MSAEFRPPEQVGFIGLGRMGAPMARRLAVAGYRLAIYDIDPAAVASLQAELACAAPPDPEALGSSCRVVITMLPDGDVVRHVLLGEHGVAAGMSSGAIVIDMSSASPIGTRALGAELNSQFVSLVDAPVSGGVRKAIDGTLAIMVGGDAAVIERVRMLLSAMGRVFIAGGSGAGHALKALNNYLSAVSLATAAEAVIAGTRFGLDPSTIVEILNASTGRSNSTEHKFPAYILPRTFDSGFALGLMAKDLRLARELAAATGTRATLLADTVSIWEQAQQRLGPAADNTEVVKYLESLHAGGMLA
jgi:3-hydroxyisobutyrate dehydrogenase